MLRRLRDALDHRTGYRRLVRAVADHPVRGGARYAYAWGSLLVFILILQVITGVTLATVYAPTTTDAWGSVYYIEHHMLMGSLVRGVHHFGSSAMIVLTIVHMTQVLLFGAHKKPRELNWVLGVLMLLVILGFGLTGYLLPWDQKGYWATQVATGIAGGTPGGEVVQTLLQGGADYGNATLTRFYVLHVFILPGALITLLVGHLALFYRHGNTPSPRVRTPRPDVPFWPYQVLRELVLAALVLGTLVALALLVGVGLEAPADPSAPYDARPEWYFLSLFQLLKVFEGPLTVIGTVILPLLAVGFLLAIPFIDASSAGKAPSRRVLVPFFGLLAGAAALTVLALTGDAQDASYQAAKARAQADADRAIRFADQGGVAPDGTLPLYEGHRIYVESGCQGCHEPSTAGEPRRAPSLVGWGTVERLSRFLSAPDHPDFFGATALATQMPATELPPAQMRSLMRYLRALTDGAPAPHGGPAAAGRALFEAHCTDCHNDPAAPVGSDDYDLTALGPDLDGLYGFEWTRRLIRDAGHPAVYGGALDASDAARAMPPYLDMGERELALLVHWLLAGAPDAR